MPKTVITDTLLVDKNMINEKLEKPIETIQYNSFESFVHQNCNKIFRYWVYRRLYTPYEMEHKFSDESVFEETICTMAHIRECIALPNGDYLLGLENAEFISDDDGQYLKYCKLSEIRLEYYECDANNN